ncbi:late gene regulator [Escherichia coli]|nr:late gene regulator [Escherichia coli]
MIYPEITGKSGEHLRLNTLEAVWIQGKLRMWGRWSYIGGGKSGPAASGRQNIAAVFQ